MKKHLINLFIPHFGNNHRAKILHHKSLTKLILILILSQFLISIFTIAKPGVLGFASNISVSQIIELTNNERQNEGLQPLKFNSTLSESAREKAVNMFANNYWAHNGPDGTSPWYFFKQVGYNYLYAGENLARDFNDSDAVIKAWMESPTHRENVMSGRYDEIGIAVLNGVLNGQETTLVVQHFGKLSGVKPKISDQAAALVPSLRDTNIKGVDANANANAEDKIPEIALQENIKAETEVKSSKIFPLKSAFDITKSINIALALVVIIALSLDGYLIFKNRQERRVGKNFVHLTLFVIVIIIILLTKNGRII